MLHLGVYALKVKSKRVYILLSNVLLFFLTLSLLAIGATLSDLPILEGAALEAGVPGGEFFFG